MSVSETPTEPGSRRIARPVPLRESVYTAILDMIVSRSLEPGQHLVESELAVMLGVSRQPVREALQWLKNDGWVDLRPGLGAFVHTPTVEEADQLLAVRSLLETESARLAATCADADGVSRLRELCDRGHAALGSEDVATMVALNAELHAAVMKMSGNDVLVELAAQVDRRVRWYYTPVARHRGKQSWIEHAALIDAIAAGDAEEAAKVMAAHTEHTRRSYLEQRDDADGSAPALRGRVH
ncbi:GntR family transcriptional regulator [Pseudonocardia sp. MH-G8]|uniref:GntR family transcriptional regulator n=1 Tax=Pseudonocardia sp. MH-G8 TaxID=1854588 RepID=UPI000BA03C03|nr:GntR family transcriptional regulator [Pseudonocardia sp. MH-G8]OZM84185.1 GntR family transcriptional regulator [Pseudonocardia sp. MH-G8]